MNKKFVVTKLGFKLIKTSRKLLKYYMISTEIKKKHFEAYAVSCFFSLKPGPGTSIYL